MQLFGDVARQYLDFADYARGESDCFEDWARRVAADPDVLTWIADLPSVKQQPNLVFAAARWHGVPAPGPYDALRTALLTDDGAIRSTISNRSTQTNEVCRLATVVPVLSRIQEEARRPLALVEVGASAGLCLLPDRFGYEWHTDHGVVRLAVPKAPTLPCEVSGTGRLPRALPQVAWRRGLDLNPLDVTDPDAAAWLANLVWPGQHERRRRLEAALGIARADPPVLVRGDLLDGLGPLVEEASRHGQVVVFHSAVVAYLDDPGRERFRRTMTGLVGRGACRWLSNEAGEVLSTAGSGVRPPKGRFVMALDGRAVAWTHPHGRSMAWL